MKRSECKLIERNHGRYYEIYEAPTGEWYLEALVGGVAMYTLTLQMTPEEIEQYKADPSIAHELSYRLGKGDEELNARLVPDLAD